MKEPSVLDYVKSLLMPWKGERIQIALPAEPVESSPETPPQGDQLAAPAKPRLSTRARLAKLGGLPYRAAAALILAIFAQMSLEPPARHIAPALVLYTLAGLYWIWALASKELQFFEFHSDESAPMPFKIRYPSLLLLCVVGFFLAYFAFSGGKFTEINLFIGLALLAALIFIFYQKDEKPDQEKRSRWWLHGFKPEWNLRITLWAVLIAAAFIVAAFFRFYRLEQVPVDMISDQAEKLFDVSDVVSGQMNIFFPRNSGREAFQFYLTAAVIQLFGTGFSFLSLKIGTGLAGMVTLIYIYLLGKEIGGQRVALLALVLAGVAYWPNVIDRVALRFALYPLFTAPALYYLVRGLRHQNRNDFIWSGIALGLGLHGYSPMRIVPFVFILLVAIYLLHRQARGKTTSTLQGFVLVGLFALIVLLPLVRYALETPDNFTLVASRAFSRLGTSEVEYPGSPVQIFFGNLWNSWIMFFYDNGSIWAHSVPSRPALDYVTAALYFLGTLAAVFRYIRSRHWIYPVLLASVPLLMMPSILSLSFPGENPSLNRSGAAYIPVFILAALGLEGILSGLSSKFGPAQRRWITTIAAVGILTWVAALNFDLVFEQYARQYALSSWNTAEMGQVAKGFLATYGETSAVYAVGYPHWVDGRLVAINAGFVRDFSIQGPDLPDTAQTPGAKLFLLSPEDGPNLDLLQAIYPDGRYFLREGRNDKNFVEFVVFPNP